MENRRLSGHGKWFACRIAHEIASGSGFGDPVRATASQRQSRRVRDDGENKGSERSKRASPDMADAMQLGERLEVTGKGCLGDQDGGDWSIGTDVHGLHDRAVLDALEDASPEVGFVGVA